MKEEMNTEARFPDKPRLALGGLPTAVRLSTPSLVLGIANRCIYINDSINDCNKVKV